MTRRLAALTTAVLAALTLAACGEKTEPAADAGARRLQPFTVVLDYYPNADHAGIYAALQDGEFRAGGAGRQARHALGPVGAAEAAAGRAGRPRDLLRARAAARPRQGREARPVGALVQKPLTTLMAIEGSGVRSAGDLRGKTVGTAGIPYQTAYLRDHPRQRRRARVLGQARRRRLQPRARR